MRNWWGSVANAAVFARAVARDAWRKPPLTSSSMFCPSNRSVSGCCRSPTRYGFCSRPAPRCSPKSWYRLPGDLHLPHPPRRIARGRRRPHPHRSRHPHPTLRLGAELFPSLVNSQRALDGLRFVLDDAQKGRRRTADPPRSLLPLAVAGQAHAHEGRHLRLRELRLLANLARGHECMNDSRTFALCMGQCPR